MFVILIHVKGFKMTIPNNMVIFLIRKCRITFAPSSFEYVLKKLFGVNIWLVAWVYLNLS